MNKLILLFSIMLLSATAWAGLQISVEGGRSGITSNTVIDIKHEALSVWLGTGDGASITTDNGATWSTYGSESIPSGEVSAMAANLGGVWVGTSHSEDAQGQSYPFGDGISLTRNGGLTWQSFMPEQSSYYGKLSYDLSVYDSIAYAACFYGGLIRTLDYGASWQNLFPSQLDTINTDSIDYAQQTYASFSNRFFSVKTDTTAFPGALSVWGGDAYGIHRFFFYSDPITHAFHTYPDSIAHYFFSAADTTMPDSLKLPGNHVVALGVNLYDTVKSIWAACRPVDFGEIRAVAYSLDDGVSWHTAPISGPGGDASVEAWDFAFSADTVFVATSFGLYRSNGDYSSWTLMTGFRDPANQTFYQDDAPFYAVDFVNGTLWAGGTDGVIKSLPNGTWDVYRSQRDPDDYYAYPSPFSPTQSIRHGTTIHFKPAASTKATVKIYDFNLDLVKTVVSDLPRQGGVESDDIVWDGTNGQGKVVANGVYFFRIELDGGEDLWGKVVVIR